MSRTLHAPKPANLAPRRGRPTSAKLVDETWLTVNEVAEMLPSFSIKAIHALAHAGEFSFSQRARYCKILITKSSVEAFLARGYRPANGGPA